MENKTQINNTPECCIKAFRHNKKEGDTFKVYFFIPSFYTLFINPLEKGQGLNPLLPGPFHYHINKVKGGLI